MRAFNKDLPYQTQANKVPNIVKTLIVGLDETYLRCNPLYTFKSSIMPIITQPHEGVDNQEYDNVNNDYIFRKGDLIKNQKKNQDYSVMYLLGVGTFGQVMCCKNQKQEKVAIKVIKNKQNFYRQALFQAKILKTVNKWEKDQVAPNKHRMVTMLDVFVWRKHLCIVFQILERNMYDLLKECNFEGMDLLWIQHWSKQIVEGLVRIHGMNIIHCDLKPENIMFKKQKENQDIRIIDFGSSCYEKEIPYKYIQSRFYRAPEVVVGMEYSTKIDMWSLGCILVELYIGLPLFPGSSSYDMLRKILAIIQIPSFDVLKSATYCDKYFRLQGDEYQLKTDKQFQEDNNITLPPSKNYYRIKSLKELKTAKGIIQEEDVHHQLFLNFVQNLLRFDPKARMSSQEAMQHRFIKDPIYRSLDD